MKLFEKIRKKYNKSLETDFLPEAIEIIEKPASPLGRFSIWITIAIIIVFLLWSIFGKMDEVVIASSVVTPIDGIKVVKPLYQGTISEIAVEEGDYVEKGQKLIVLDTSMEQIGLDNIQKQIDNITFQNKLLKLISSNQDIDLYSEQSDEEKKKIYELIFSIQENYKSQCSQCDSQISQYQKQLEIERKSLDKLKKDMLILENRKKELSSIYEGDTPGNKSLEKIELQIKVAEDELESYEKLYSSNAISKSQLVEKQNELEDLEKQYEVQKVVVNQENIQNKIEIDEVSGQIELLQPDIDAQQNRVDMQLEVFEQAIEEKNNIYIEYTRDISDMIVSNNNTLSELNSELQTKLKYLDGQTLVAPENGYIQTLAVNTIGSVVSSAEPAVYIVPEDSELIIEATVLNRDIGFIYIGQEVSVKIDAFSFQKYGTISGKVISVSPNAIKNELGELVYLVKIALEEKTININGNELNITAGMTGTSEVKISERPIIEFFIEPLVEYFDTSLKVR